ncbi:MAG: glycerophosphodiester phosphodiesterase family protein [Candidatus Dojkabacteria bacterium]|nr:glycerophosphodiester phosphodiesterase family protein [Candidatus Dojkabacteria bacterium]MDQ7021091.1 glycerophosphodiester phosphodiesterase family protein [Candidatus Dojkabacteria bacterium]
MKIIAHGGYSAKYKENTLRSYLEAIKLLPDVLEIDLCLSSDGIVLCTHSKTAREKYGVDVENLNYESFKDLIDENGDILISRFEDIIEKINTFKGKLMFDLKQDSLGLVDKALEIVKLK